MNALVFAYILEQRRLGLLRATSQEDRVKPRSNTRGSQQQVAFSDSAANDSVSPLALVDSKGG